MRCPFATWQGSPNVGGTLIRPAKGLVVHVEVGTEAGTNSCFQNPSFKASAHFGCAKNGALDQWVDTDAVAWAEVAGNGGWISVETEGVPTEPLTDAQVTSVARLFVWLQGIYGFPFQTCDHDGTGLTTHAHYPSGIGDPQWGGHPCPGTLRSAQLPTILARAQGSPTAPTEEDMYSAAEDSITGGQWLLTPDGGIQTTDGAPFLGALTTHPDWHADKPAAITYWKGDNTPTGGQGYRVSTICDAHGVSHYYRFRRNGADKGA